MTEMMETRAKPIEYRPDDDGSFDEIVARFADGTVHVETTGKKGCYVGFYWNDGRVLQWWVSADKKLRYRHSESQGAPLSPLPSTRKDDGND